MAQTTLSCCFAAIHLEAALSECPVDTRNRRGFSAEKQIPHSIKHPRHSVWSFLLWRAGGVKCPRQLTFLTIVDRMILKEGDKYEEDVVYPNSLRDSFFRLFPREAV